MKPSLISLAVLSLAFLTAAARAAEPPAAPRPPVGQAFLAAQASRLVKSVDLLLPRKADVPVAQGLFQTRAGAPFSAPAVAGDLHRLGLLGYTLTQFDARFGADGVALTIGAYESPIAATLRVESVEFDGGDTSVNDACRAALTQRASTVFRPCALDCGGALRDAETIEAMYRSRGWLDARVAALSVRTNEATPPRVESTASARVRFTVETGRHYAFSGKITVQGSNKVKFPDPAHGDQRQQPRPWTPEQRAEILSRATRQLTDQGHLDARVEATTEKQPNGTVDVHLDVTEGDLCTLNQATLEGAGQYKDQVAKLITLTKGQPIRSSEIDALRTAIEDLGVFTEVEMLFPAVRAGAEDKPAGNRDLVIRVTRIDLGREISPAEARYYEMMQNLVRLYNRGKQGVRSATVRGFFTFGSRRIDIDAALVRPGQARVRLVIQPDAAEKDKPAQQIILTGSPGRSFVRLSALDVIAELPGTPSLRIAVLPPDPDRNLPAEVQIAPGLITNLKGEGDVLLFGERCPPAAVYFTRQAARFTQSPPKLEADGTLVVPDEAGGAMKFVLDKDKLPRKISTVDKDGRVTSEFETAINPDIPAAAFELPAGEKQARPISRVLAVPLLSALGLTGLAASVAEKAAAEQPKDADCLAARGLARLATGPAEPALADLRVAAEASGDPAYGLLLAETLIRARQFAEADAVCKKLLASPPVAGAQHAVPLQLRPADLLLASGISPNAAFDAILHGPDDYRRRAALDRALALIGLKQFQAAADLARAEIKPPPAQPNAPKPDTQAAEILARCELSLGHPDAARTALAAIEPISLPGRGKGEGELSPQAQVYAALAHAWLSEKDKAAAALGDAISKNPAFRNLLLLQEQAAEIHPRFDPPAARAALARIFSRATTGALKPEEKAKLAAIVNDAYVVGADVDAIAKQLSTREDLKTEPVQQLRAAALRRIIEDMLIVRWAMWRGIRVPDDDLYRAMQEEMRSVAGGDPARYRAWLAERGSGLLQRPGEIRDALLRRRAFAAALEDKVRVSPAQVEKFYAENPKQFTVPPAVQMRMISLEFARFRDKAQALDLAQALLKRLTDKPGSFEQLAREYSQDANAERGGLWDEVTQDSLIDPLGKTVFALKAGQTSGVIETDRGCHIVRVEKVTPQRVVTLEEAAPYIVRSMQEALARPATEAWLDRLRAESCVELLNGYTIPENSAQPPPQKSDGGPPKPGEGGRTSDTQDK